MNIVTDVDLEVMPTSIFLNDDDDDDDDDDDEPLLLPIGTNAPESKGMEHSTLGVRTWEVKDQGHTRPKIDFETIGSSRFSRYTYFQIICTEKLEVSLAS